MFKPDEGMNILGKPTGLNDGSNNYYASNGPGLLATNTLGLLVTGWQGVTISGLTAGDYMFEFIEQANPTADWAEWNNTLNNIFTLKAGDIGGDPSPVPLPEAFPLYGAGLVLLGFMVWRKRRQSNKA